MPNISSRAGLGIVKLVLGLFFVVILLICYVFALSYQSRSSLITSQQAGCERSKLDRNANAQGWRTAEVARLESTAKTLHISFDKAKWLEGQKPKSDDLPDMVAARRYNTIASGLEKRSRIKCNVVFPKAGFFP